MALICIFCFASCGKKSDDKETNGKNSSSAGTSGITQTNVDSELLKTKIATADFDGKDYTFYYWYETNEIIGRKIAAFNKAHNANITVTIGTSFKTISQNR